MTDPALPFRTAGEITAAAMDAALRHAGVLADGATVAEVQVSPVGTGQMADSLRVALTYEGTAGPASVIAKLASTDERSRTTGRLLRAYEVEVGFYNEVAAIVHIRTPRCHLAAIDLDTHDFVLLLEDLAPATQGDQIEGCDADLAARVLDQAAALHAPRWNDPALRHLSWLDRTTPAAAAATSAIVASLYPGFVERFGPGLAPEVLDGLERGMARIGDWWRGVPGAATVLHGDLRLDNLLLGEGSDDIWTVDWQTVVVGNGVADAAYFVGGNLLPEVRRAHEDDLVRHYHQALVDRGVADLTWDECWARYRHGTWHGVYLCVAAAMLVEQTERGDLMFSTDIDRHVRHALDLDAFDVFDRFDESTIPGASRG